MYCTLYNCTFTVVTTRFLKFCSKLNNYRNVLTARVPAFAPWLSKYFKCVTYLGGNQWRNVILNTTWTRPEENVKDFCETESKTVQFTLKYIFKNEWENNALKYLNLEREKPAIHCLKSHSHYVLWHFIFLLSVLATVCHMTNTTLTHIVSRLFFPIRNLLILLYKSTYLSCRETNRIIL